MRAILTVDMDRESDDIGEGCPALARQLRAAATLVERYGRSDADGGDLALHDARGNRVGELRIEEEPQPVNPADACHWQVPGGAAVYACGAVDSETLRFSKSRPERVTCPRCLAFLQRRAEPAQPTTRHIAIHLTGPLPDDGETRTVAFFCGCEFYVDSRPVDGLTEAGINFCHAHGGAQPTAPEFRWINERAGTYRCLGSCGFQYDDGTPEAHRCAEPTAAPVDVNGEMLKVLCYVLPILAAAYPARVTGNNVAVEHSAVVRVRDILARAEKAKGEGRHCAHCAHCGHWEEV